jgi:hypothetical protein
VRGVEVLRREGVNVRAIIKERGAYADDINTSGGDITIICIFIVSQA